MSDGLIAQAALAAAVGWGEGVMLYAVVLILGMLGRFGGFDLPPSPQVCRIRWSSTSATCWRWLHQAKPPLPQPERHL